MTRHRIPFRLHNIIAYLDRAPIIEATKGRGHTVPCLIDGQRGICDVTDLDRRWRVKVNDTYVILTRPLIEQTMLIRHKERKFGRGCVQEWTTHRRYLCTQFAELLKPIDNMLSASPFLLPDRPLFVDSNLYGVLGNYLFNGKTRLPNLKYLRRWCQVMNTRSKP